MHNTQQQSDRVSVHLSRRNSLSTPPPVGINGADAEREMVRFDSDTEKKNEKGKKNRRQHACRVRSFIGSSLRSAERKKKKKKVKGEREKHS